MFVLLVQTGEIFLRVNEAQECCPVLGRHKRKQQFVRLRVYYMVSVPETHPQYQFFRERRQYWMGEFGYDRKDQPKGIVRTLLASPATTAATQVP